jgi:hypothetical protein
MHEDWQHIQHSPSFNSPFTHPFCFMAYFWLESTEGKKSLRKTTNSSRNEEKRCKKNKRQLCKAEK